METAADPRDLTVRRYPCGCLTAHTIPGYLAEEQLCPEALPLAARREAAREYRESLAFDDPRLLPALDAVERADALLRAHRSRSGQPEAAVRPPGTPPRPGVRLRPRGLLSPAGGRRTEKGTTVPVYTLKVHTGPALTDRIAALVSEAGLHVPLIGAEHVYADVPVPPDTRDPRPAAKRLFLSRLRERHGTDFGLGRPALQVLDEDAAAHWTLCTGDTLRLPPTTPEEVIA